MATLTGADILGLTSAAGLLVLGVALLLLPRRSPPALTLALVALLWGGQVLAVRIALVLGPGGAGELFLLLSMAFLVPAYAAIAQFAALYPQPLPFSRRAPWLAVLAAPAVLATALFLSDRASAVSPGTPTSSIWGWASILLLVLPLLGALVFALARFALGFARSKPGPGRRQLFLGTVALLAFLAYYVPYLGLRIPPDFAARVTPAGAALFVAAVLAGGVAVAAFAARSLARATPAERPLLAATLALSFGSSLATAQPGTPDVLGLWRLAMVAFLAYGIARYQLVDADIRLRPWLAPTAAFAIGLSTWGVAAAALGVESGVARQMPGFAASGVVGAAVALLAWPLVKAWIDRTFPHIRATEEYLLRRKLEVYRATSEGGADAAQREALARDLGLREHERALLDRGAAGSAGDAAPGERLAGRYRIERMLAAGVFGRVWVAWDERVEERVVLKEYAGFLGGGAGKSFAREAKALGVEHPNVIAGRDAFRLGPDLYLALEHADGGSLEDRLRTGPLPLEEALRVMRDVLAGLGAAHARGIVHRDVKPANILFVKGTAKLADFGIAADPVLEAAFRAMAGQPGTVGWMAPEQARGEAATPESDVYAAGRVLHAMLGGHAPRGPTLLGGAARRSRGRQPDPVAGVPPEVNAFLARAMAEEPAGRFPDARAMRKALPKPQRMRMVGHHCDPTTHAYGPA